MFDTLDTYFVFLRTRVLTGEITPEQEVELVEQGEEAMLTAQSGELPALKRYFDNWTDAPVAVIVITAYAPEPSQLAGQETANRRAWPGGFSAFSPSARVNAPKVLHRLAEELDRGVEREDDLVGDQRPGGEAPLLRR